ncbi:MmcQ/YjbR family DNA-binding protein [Phenylobacterium sp.]|jgi:predicted DNA-binding protein (MmcQ/YjbR family)|uniref:MmcQ/YjbR family DNA-binding protein n=1 Tax=Phenylobacterium sp. TaxID=1871053 RepID=UPI002F94C8BB
MSEGAAAWPGPVDEICRGLPGVTHVIQWGGSDVYKVGGKVFAICGEGAVSFKVTEIGFEVLTGDGGPARQAPYLAKGQWVIVNLADATPEDLNAWLVTSHDLIAAKLTKKARLELGLA